MPRRVKNANEDIDLDLHYRLLEGDRTATMTIVKRHLAEVIRSVETDFSNLHDPALVEEASHDALSGYFRNPVVYNPEKLSLRRFLVMAAKDDLRNLLQKERRRWKRQPVRLDHVELHGADAEQIIDSSNDPARLELDQSHLLAKIRNVLPQAADREILELMMGGERSTAVFARALGIEALPVDEQEKIVKRNKDRIKKRLQRARILDP